MRSSRSFFTKAERQAETAGIEVPEEIPGQARRRKLPQKYKYVVKSEGKKAADTQDRV